MPDLDIAASTNRFNRRVVVLAIENGGANEMAVLADDVRAVVDNMPLADSGGSAKLSAADTCRYRRPAISPYCPSIVEKRV